MNQIFYQNGIEIVEALPQHTALLRDLGEQTFREAYSENTADQNMELYVRSSFTIDCIENDFYNPKTKFLLARCGADWCGYALLRWDKTHELLGNSRVLLLHRIYVKKDFWRHKVGSALLQHVLDFAKAEGYEWLWLVVWDQNDRAIRFYKQWGFEHFGYEKFQFGDEITDDWAMRKKII